MPNLLTFKIKKTLRLLHPIYQQKNIIFDEKGYALREEFASYKVLQGKTLSSDDLNIQTKQEELIANLVAAGVQYVVFCGFQAEPMYKVFNRNKRFDVLYLEAIEKISDENIVKLHAMIKGKKDKKTYFFREASSSQKESVDRKSHAIYLVSEDGLNANGIIAFALYCYEKICTLADYPNCRVEDLADFLMFVEKGYKKFDETVPVNASKKQFVSAVELTFRLMEIDAGKQALTAANRDENFWQQVETNYQFKAGKYIKQKYFKALDVLNKFVEKPQENLEVIVEKLKQIGSYLRIMKACFGGQLTQLQKIDLALLGKLQKMLCAQNFEFIKILKQKLFDIDCYEGVNQIINEAMATNYEKMGNDWDAKQEHTEAKIWLMLAYILSNNLERENRLWPQLESILDLTRDKPASALGTEGRSIWNTIKSLFLDTNLDETQLKLYGLQREAGRRAAGKLFSLHCYMFRCVNRSDKVPLVSESKFPTNEIERFGLNDKAKLAFRYLIVYLEKLQYGDVAWTNKLVRLVERFEDLSVAAKKLSEDKRIYLSQQLEDMGLFDLKLFLQAKAENDAAIAAPSESPSHRK